MVYIICIFVTVNISFGITNYSIFEATDFVELNLTKTPGALVPLTVNLFTMDGTAG